MPYHNWKKIITYLIIGIIIGYFGRGLLGGTYQAGWQEAMSDPGGKIKVMENGEEVEKYKLIGRITAIDDNKLQVVIDNIKKPPKSKDDRRGVHTKTVKIAKDAVIILNRMVDKYYYYSQVDPTGTEKLKNLSVINIDNLEREERYSLREEINSLEDQLSESLQQTKSDLRQQISIAEDNSTKKQLYQELNSLTTRFLESTITVADLRVDDRIIIISDKDIRYDDKIKATDIKIER